MELMDVIVVGSPSCKAFSRVPVSEVEKAS